MNMHDRLNAIDDRIDGLGEQVWSNTEDAKVDTPSRSHTWVKRGSQSQA